MNNKTAKRMKNKEALEQKMENREALKQELKQLLQEKKWEQMESLCSKWLQWEPSRAITYYNRAFAFAKLKRFEESIADLEKTLLLNPNLTPAHKLLAKIEKYWYHLKSTSQHDYSEKETATKSTTQINPSHIFAQGKDDLKKLFSQITPKEFDRYQVQKRIGKGGMGEVYLAFDPKLNRKVAIKTVVNSSPQMCKRLLREVKIMTKLSHPNIVKVYQAEFAKEPYYFTMDYIQGVNLSQWCQKRKITIRQALEIVYRISQAIVYAHREGILHRDLKPTNIIIMDNGTPMVMDFGLGIDMENHSRLSQSGSPLGTPAYMPPEQALGKRKEIDRCSDVYSLGAILYVLLTGSAPFTGDNPAIITLRTINRDPIPPSQISNAVPHEVENICLKAMAKEKKHRYQSARELADDIRRFLNGEPVHAMPPSIIYQAYKWVHRNKVITYTCFILLLFFFYIAVFCYDLISIKVKQASRALFQAKVAKKQVIAMEKKLRNTLVKANKAKKEIQNALAIAISEGKKTDKVSQKFYQQRSLLYKRQEELIRKESLVRKAILKLQKDIQENVQYHLEKTNIDAILTIFKIAKIPEKNTKLLLTIALKSPNRYAKMAAVEALQEIIPTKLMKHFEEGFYFNPIPNTPFVNLKKGKDHHQRIQEYNLATYYKLPKESFTNNASDKFDKSFNKLVEERGGDNLTQKAVEAGLQWLKNHQSPDGRWDADGFTSQCGSDPRYAGSCSGHGSSWVDVGITGLALLCFLNAGSTTTGGKFKQQVKKSIRFLENVQDSEGCFGKRRGHYMYNHAIATIAMVKACNISSYSPIKISAQKGVDFLVKAQNPHLGWRYSYQSGDNDTSATTWCTKALKAAQIAGINVPFTSFENVLKWIDSVTDEHYYRTGYMQKGDAGARLQGSENFARTEAMTAAGMMSRIFSGVNRSDSKLQDGAGLLSAQLPNWGNGPDGKSQIDFLYWFWGTQAMYHIGEDHWKNWNEKIKSILVENQQKNGCNNGSWDPIDPWGAAGSRIYATAINILSLEIYYLAPTTEKKKKRNAR